MHETVKEAKADVQEKAASSAGKKLSEYACTSRGANPLRSDNKLRPAL